MVVALRLVWKLQLTVLQAIERSVKHRVVGRFGGIVNDGREEKVFPVGKKERPARGGMHGGVGVGPGFYRTATRRDAHERCVGIRFEQNVAAALQEPPR